MKTEKGQGEEGQEGGEQDGGIEGAVEQTGIDMEDCLTSGGEHGLQEPLAPEHDVEWGCEQRLRHALRSRGARRGGREAYTEVAEHALERADELQNWLSGWRRAEDAPAQEGEATEKGTAASPINRTFATTIASSPCTRKRGAEAAASSMPRSGGRFAAVGQQKRARRNQLADVGWKGGGRRRSRAHDGAYTFSSIFLYP